jgi:hypothetical protein
MITRLLEAKAIIGEKTIPIINTQMEIFVDWDIAIRKYDENAELLIDYKIIYGDFIITEQKSNCTKSTKTTFMTDKSWKINSFFQSKLPYIIEPLIAKINFDTKQIDISF